MLIADHEHYMRMAIQEAHVAAEEGDVPVGAVLVHNNTIVGKAHNQVELLKDPTAHAEMIAITQAANDLGDWRLTDTVLYITKEPCTMCAGAIALARIPTVVYGVPDPQKGGVDIIRQSCNIVSGILEDENRLLLQDFFRKLRLKDNEEITDE